MIYNSCGITG